MRRVKGVGLFAAALVVLAGTAACGDTGSVGADAVRGDARPTASPTPSASPTPGFDQAATAKLVRAAAIAPRGMASIGVSSRPTEESAKDYGFAAGCGGLRADNFGEHASYYRKWSESGWYVAQIVRGYSRFTGATVVEQIQEAVTTCPRSKTDGTLRVVLKPVKLPSYPGVEARYGWCEKRTGESDYIICIAVLGRGNVATKVEVVRYSQKATTNGLIGVAAVAAERLADTVSANRS